MTEQLTTLVTVKREFGVDPNDVRYDDYLTSLICQASDRVSTYCNRKFERQSLTDTHHIVPGTQRPLLIYVSRPPVQTTPVVTLYDSQDNTSVADASMIVTDADAGIVTVQRTDTTTAGTWARAEVAYEGGWYLPPDTVNTPDLPCDIERGCLELCKHMWERSMQIRQRQRESGVHLPEDGIKRKTIAGVGAITYFSAEELGTIMLPENSDMELVDVYLAPWVIDELDQRIQSVSPVVGTGLPFWGYQL